MEPLVLDREALQKLGLYHESLYAVEYDLPRGSDKFDKKTNQFLRNMRNHIVYELKYKLRAIKNLDSSWFIDKTVLDKSTELLNQMILEYKMHKPSFDVSKRIRILVLLTTPEGFECYQDRKAEFLLQFLNESIEKVQKGVSDEIMSESVLWRCKASVELIESNSETLKHHEQYNVIADTLVMLVDMIQEYENIKKDKKEKKKLNK